MSQKVAPNNFIKLNAPQLNVVDVPGKKERTFSPLDGRRATLCYPGQFGILINQKRYLAILGQGDKKITASELWPLHLQD